MSQSQIEHDRLVLLCTELEKRGFELWKRDDSRRCYSGMILGDGPDIQPEDCGSRKYWFLIIGGFIKYVTVTYGKGDMYSFYANEKTYFSNHIHYNTVGEVIYFLQRKQPWTD